MGLPYMLISWGGLGVNVGIYGIHGVFGNRTQRPKPARALGKGW